MNPISLDKVMEGSRLDARKAIADWVRSRKHEVRVLSFDEAARRIGSTRRTLDREIAEGRGPVVVQVTKGKTAILEEDFAAWVRSRRRVAPTKANEEIAVE
jgi:predicted DNA-binding transcriptional regulator AlpA